MRISMFVMIVSFSHCASVSGVWGMRRWRSSWVMSLSGPVVGWVFSGFVQKDSFAPCSCGVGGLKG